MRKEWNWNSGCNSQQPVGQHHVVHHVALADLLAAELFRSRQVLAVVVAEVVVGHNAANFDAGAHEVINEYAFDLGLPRLEVVASNLHRVKL